MVLVDTSVWIKHFRSGLPHLAELLGRQQVICHPVVIGELAMGNLANRNQTLTDLRYLPEAVEGSFAECLGFLETHRLFGVGLGWGDVQLLVAAKLTHAPLWSHDKRLSTAVSALEVCYVQP